MRNALIVFLLGASAVCAASNYRDVAQAVNNDALLAGTGVAPAEAELRKQCRAAVVETDDPPEFFDCVYVQTAKELNLFSLEDGYLMSELELTLRNIDGVALQRMDRWSQLQIFSGSRVTALYIHGGGWIDPAQNEVVYQWLIGHGVPTREPRKWIGP